MSNRAQLEPPTLENPLRTALRSDRGRPGPSMLRTPPARRTSAHRTSGLLPVGSLLLCVLTAAFSLRDRALIDPERGLGYGLGLAAGILLLLVLVYPLRKRLPRLRIGRVARWFSLHMVLGLVVPTLVLLHCNFSSGALNSTVALSVLLTVVGSGLVGRFLYARIHKGLYGARALLPDLLADAARLRAGLGTDHAEGLWQEVSLLEERVASAPRSLAGRIWSSASTRRRTRRLRRSLARDHARAVSHIARSDRGSRRRLRERQSLLTGRLDAYLDTIDRAASLPVLERLFGIWHVLHVPLLVLLVIAVSMHIVAVHLY